MGIGVAAFPPNLSFSIHVRYQLLHPKFGLHRHGSLPCQIANSGWFSLKVVELQALYVTVRSKVLLLDNVYGALLGVCATKAHYWPR